MALLASFCHLILEEVRKLRHAKVEEIAAEIIQEADLRPSPFLPRGGAAAQFAVRMCRGAGRPHCGRMHSVDDISSWGIIDTCFRIKNRFPLIICGKLPAAHWASCKILTPPSFCHKTHKNLNKKFRGGNPDGRGNRSPCCSLRNPTFPV